nr:isochorismate synthase [Bacillus piscicola]
MSFYAAARLTHKGSRFFWQDPRKEILIAGAGNITKFQEMEACENRYQQVEKKWLSLCENAVTAGITEKMATGPLLFGGFSFDQQEHNRILWKKFGDYLFYIPEYMLSVVEGQAYFTVNVLCTAEEEETELLKLIQEQEQQLLCHREEDISYNRVVQQLEIAPERWKQTVAKAVQEMKQSDLDKVVLARELRLTCQREIQTEGVLQNLLRDQPGSYVFSLEAGSDCFIGATPEKLIQRRGDTVYSDCLAGSIARGTSIEEDSRLGSELLQDRKNLLEHEYVVSMITDVFREYCQKIEVPQAPELMKNRHIQHLYTPISGSLHDGVSVLDFVAKLHPTPAMGGVPQKQAVTCIREWEQLERGFYAAPLGWLDAYGNSDIAVGIRSALVQGSEASLFAGGGVLPDSTPDSEYEETAIKFNPMLSALGGQLS